MLYIGTDADGLLLLNVSTFKIEKTINYTNGLPGDGHVWSLELDKANNILYIGTSGGLAIYDIKNDTISVRNTWDGLAERHVFGITLDGKRHKLYINTWSTELSVYDIQNDAFRTYDIHERWPGPDALNSDSSILYVEGQDKLHLFDPDTMHVIDTLDFEDVLATSVADILWDERNSWLYIGSNSGLGIYDPYYVGPSDLSATEDIDTDGNHTVYWDAGEGAEWYTLERSYTANFSDSEIIYEGNGTEINFSNLSAGEYWYRVRGNNSIRTGEWSNSMVVKVVFKPDMPVLLSVNYTAENGTVSVAWSKVSGADNYSLEERCIINEWESGWYSLYGGNETSAVLDNHSGNVTYEYRVRASNLAGYGEYSSVLALNGTVFINANNTASNTSQNDNPAESNGITTAFYSNLLPITAGIMALLILVGTVIFRRASKKDTEEKK